MKKVTLIVPAYNSEKYLSKCLDSILNQTYDNYEIIVVNDGSTDKTQEIIDIYSNKYPDKIIAVQQENKGVSITRNESIVKANGEYIMFIDNDDYIDKDYIETYIKEIENGYDVVLGGYRRPNEEGKVLRKMIPEDKEFAKFIIMAPWAKIYRKNYLINNQIEFLNVNIGEDVYFNLKAMLKSEKIKIIDYVGYNWFFNTASVSNSNQKDIRNLQVFDLLNNSYDMLEKEGLINEKYEIIKTYFTRYIVWILTFATKKLKYNVISEEYDKLFDWLNKKFPNYKKNKMISFSKPEGDEKKIKIITKLFLEAHKMKLGKLLIYIYSKI